jgi:hypothetical protein
MDQKEAIEALLDSRAWWGSLCGVLVFLAIGGEVFFHALYRSAEKRREAIVKEEDDERAKTLARLRKKTAVANRRAAEADAKAEELKRANLELEARVAPRRLSPEDQTEFSTLGAQYAGQRFKITWPVGDMEAASFAAQLIRLLLWTGWINVDDNRAMPRSYEGERILLGVRLLPGIDQKSQEATEFLLNWLRSKRIGTFPVLPAEELRGLPVDDVLEVRVGVKLSTFTDNKFGIR